MQPLEGSEGGGSSTAQLGAHPKGIVTQFLVDVFFPY